MPSAPPEPVFVLRGHRAAVQCVAFLPNSKGLAAGDAEGELKLWDLDSRRPTASIRAHESTSGILQVACPASHPWVVSQGRDGVVKCWELHPTSSMTSQPVQQLASGCYNFCRFALLEPGQTSSSCGTSQPPPDLTQQAAPPAQLVVDGFTAAAEPATNTGRLAVSSSSDGAGGSQQQVAARHQHHIGTAGLLSQQLKAHPQQPQTSVQQSQEQQAHQVLCGDITALNLTAGAGADADRQVSAADDVDLTEAAEEQLMLRNTGSSSNTTTTSNSSAGGPCWLALPATNPAHLGIWQLGGAADASATQRPLMLLQQGSTSGHTRGQCMAVVLLQPQGGVLHALTGYEDGSVALWDSRNCSTYLAAQKLHSEPVMCLAAAADCSSGFSGSADDKLAAFQFDISKGHLMAGPQMALPQQGLADVAIRPDGRIAATAGWDAKVRVWHCRKHQPLAILRWHSQQVACVAFSSDNSLLAAGGRDNAISMWSLYPPKDAVGQPLH